MAMTTPERVKRWLVTFSIVLCVLLGGLGIIVANVAIAAFISPWALFISAPVTLAALVASVENV